MVTAEVSPVRGGGGAVAGVSALCGSFAFWNKHLKQPDAKPIFSLAALRTAEELAVAPMGPGRE